MPVDIDSTDIDSTDIDSNDITATAATVTTLPMSLRTDAPAIITGPTALTGEQRRFAAGSPRLRTVGEPTTGLVSGQHRTDCPQTLASQVPASHTAVSPAAVSPNAPTQPARAQQPARQQPERTQQMTVPRLSTREVEVLLAWFASDSKDEAAARLFISSSTVNTHLTRIRAKYAAAGRPAKSKASLFARAVQDGHTDLDAW